MSDKLKCRKCGTEIDETIAQDKVIIEAVRIEAVLHHNTIVPYVLDVVGPAPDNFTQREIAATCCRCWTREDAQKIMFKRKPNAPAQTQSAQG